MITAAEQTGPARHPLPASSHPASSLLISKYRFNNYGRIDK